MKLWVVCNVFFFFSSRRRHTRSLRDWSRRVLFRSLARPRSQEADSVFSNMSTETRLTLGEYIAALLDVLAAEDAASRSEERRVGKECRSRSSRYHLNKKRQMRGAQSHRILKPHLNV